MVELVVFHYSENGEINMKLYFLLVFKKTTISTLKASVYLPAYALYNCKTLSLKQRYHEHIRHVKQNDPQSAYALNVLNNKHEYGSINNIISSLKQVNKGTLLMPLKQFIIPLHYHHN
jgi:hypothetical protein